MLKTTLHILLIVCSILLVSCSTGRIKFGPKYERAKTEANTKTEHAQPVEVAEVTASTLQDIASTNDDLELIITPSVEVPSPVSVADSTEQQTNEEQTTATRKRKKKKEPSVFKKGMQMSGISSGAFAIAVVTFFLHGISVYIPVVGVILCIVGVYFFVRGLSLYLDAKETLQWYPKEYAKAQKYGWATTVLIINCLMFAAALVGVASLIF